MNPQPDQDLERRLQKLEVEINQTPPSPPVLQPPEQILQPPTDTSKSVQTPLKQFTNWFNGLSTFGKLIAIGVTALLSLAILQVVLKLVTTAISLAILGVILYLIYQFFWARRSDKD